MGVVAQPNPESFESIYNRLYIPVYKYFAKRLSDKAFCEDLTSEVFYSCYKNFDRYNPAKATIETWIYSIAANRLKNHYRDKKDALPIDEVGIARNLFANPDFEGAVYLTQMKTHLETVLKSLTERERRAIELRYYSELSSEEIAQKLGTTAGNVRVILTRTLKKIAISFEAKGIRWEL